RQPDPEREGEPRRRDPRRALTGAAAAVRRALPPPRRAVLPPRAAVDATRRSPFDSIFPMAAGYRLWRTCAQPAGAFGETSGERLESSVFFWGCGNLPNGLWFLVARAQGVGVPVSLPSGT